MADPVEFEDWALYPPDTANAVIDQQFFRQWHDKVIKRIRAIPEIWTGSREEIAVVNTGETGFTPVSESGISEVKFGGLPVVDYRLSMVTATGSISLSQGGHLCRIVNMNNGSAATISVSLGSNPASSVFDGFICHVRRLLGTTGNVTVAAGSGLTLYNIDGHTRIKEGGLAQLTVIGTTLYFEGRTE